MRNVLLVSGVMIFFLWDGLFNSGRYLDATVRTIHSFFALFGLS